MTEPLGWKLADELLSVAHRLTAQGKHDDAGAIHQAIGWIMGSQENLRAWEQSREQAGRLYAASSLEVPDA